MSKRVVWFTGLLVLLFCVSAQATELPRVVFVNPDRPGNPFWDSVTGFMQAAAENLGVDLSVRYGDANRVNTTKQATEAVFQDRPDYLLTIYQATQGQRILDAAEKAKVHTLIFNTDITESDREAVGMPGEKYQYWLGHLVPDDRQAGYDLADYLIGQALLQNPLDPVRVVAITGSRDSSAAIYRNDGMLRAIDRHPQAQLEQLIYSEWDPERVSQQMPFIFDRYPDTQVIWAASDAMALAASQYVQEQGPDGVLIGGIDWTSPGIKAVKKGNLAVTIGGHFMDGAWALVLLLDHFNQRLKPGDIGHTTLSMQMLNRNNVGEFRPYLDPASWKDLNFRSLTRTYNPQRQNYELSLKALLDQS